MAVKPLAEYQQQQRKAKSLAAYQARQTAGVKSLADYQVEQARQVDQGLRDPYLGEPVGYRLGDLGVEPPVAPEGLFFEGKDRELFEDLMDPMYFGQATGRHLERDPDGKLKAYYSMKLPGLPPAMIDRHPDWIAEALFGEKWRETYDAKTAGQRIKDYYRNGQIQVQRSDLALQVLMGADTPETWKELDRLAKAMDKDAWADFRPGWEKMLSATAEIMPYSVEGIKAAPVGAGVGAIAGGTAAIVAGSAGPQVALPDEAVTAPALIWSGVKLGGGVAAAHRIGEIEAGGALLDLLEMGVDPAIAKAAAVGVGVLNGALEVAQISTLLKTMPGGKTLAATTVRDVVNKLVKDNTFRNLAARHVAQFGTYLSAETLQELAQESVNVTAEQLAAVLHEKLKGQDIDTQTIDEIVARFREVGLKSLQGFTVLGIPGSAMSATVEAGETIVMRGSPAQRMLPNVRETNVKIPAPDPVETAEASSPWDPEDLPEGLPGVQKRTPAAIAEAEALAAKGLEAAKPQAEMTPGQTVAKPGAVRFYHGTHAENVDNIKAAGFIPSDDGTAGPGVYVGETPEATLYERNPDLSDSVKRMGRQPDTAIPVSVHGKIFDTGIYGRKDGPSVYVKPHVWAATQIRPDLPFKQAFDNPQAILKEAGYVGVKWTFQDGRTGTVVFDPTDVSPVTQAGSASPTVQQSLTVAATPQRSIEDALGDLSLSDLTAKAKEIGVAVKGKKAQLAALIAEAIRAKVAGKQTKAERAALTETEAAIAGHPLYQEYDHADVTTHRIKMDPDAVYFVEPKYAGDVEGYIGKPGQLKYNAAVGNHITFDKNKGQAWDDAVQEQGFEFSFDEFMENLVLSVTGVRAGRSAGLNENALAEALRSDEPELVMLARKREMLREGRSVWEINQELHGIAGDYHLDQADYQHVLIGGDMAAAPGEPHPGALTYKEFSDRLGRELVDYDSPWMKRWALPSVAEKPREMWNRLRAEWQAIKAHDIAAELNIEQVADASKPLTAAQEADLETIDAEKVADQIIKKHKDTLIGKLIGSMFDDAVEAKRLRQALINAYKAGTKEGIAEAREAYRQARQKIKARRELREYVAKLLRIIKKPVGKSVAFSQRMAIQLIQQQIDPKFRRLDTVEKRRRSREYFEKHPEAEAPRKTMALIESVAPNELTVAQLETIAREVSELKRKGRILRKQDYEARLARNKADINAVTEALTGGVFSADALEPVVKAPDVTMRQKLRDLFRLTLTPERVLDWFDGRRLFQGPIFKLFWEQVADAENEKLRRVHDRLDSARQALADVGMTLADLQQTMLTIRGKELSVQDAVGVYLFGKNYLSKQAVTFGNFISETDQKRIADAVESDTRLVALSNYILQHYEDHYARLREAVIQAEDRDMGKEDNYTPMRRMERDYTPDERNLLTEMLQREHFKRGYAEKGMTLARKDIEPEFQKPIRLDAWTLLLEQIERQEHYIAFAELTKRLRRIVANEAVQDALARKHSPAAWQWLRNYVDVVANPNIYKTWSQAENLARMIRRHTTIAFLSWKLSTALKQVASLSLYLPEAGHHLLQAGFEAASDWQRVREFVTSRDPMVEFAALERELEELKASKPGQYKDLVRRFGEAGLKGLMWFDAPTRTIGWYGVYLAEHAQAVADGLDAAAADQRATEAARLTTSRTQPGARAFQLPELYRSNEAYNLLLQFTNQLNKLWNMTTYDLAALVGNKQYSRAAMMFAAVGLQAGLIWTITHRRLPEDDDDFKDIALEGFVGLLPVVGSNIIALERGFGGGDIAASAGAAEFATNTYKALEGLTAGDVDLKTLEAAYRGMAPVVGLPYTGPKNLIEFGTTGNAYYLLGGLPSGQQKNPNSKAAVKRRKRP